MQLSMLVLSANRLLLDLAYRIVTVVPAECVEEFGFNMQVILEGTGLSQEEAAAAVTEITTQLSSTILAFWTWG